MHTMIEAIRSLAGFRRSLLVGALGAGLVLAAGAAQAQVTTPDHDDTEPGGICEKFPEMGNTSGFAACPARPRIIVSTDDTQPIDGPYLLLQDLSGASEACNTSPEFTGNWLEKVGGCGQLCFDFRVFHAGFPPAPVYPRIFFTDASGIRAVFKAFNPVTSDDGWVHVCAPIRAVDPGETTLPASATGEWRIEDAPGNGNFSNAGASHIAAWNSGITNVATFRLPIDFTSQPSEKAGYDNFCFTPGGCGKPEPKACLQTEADVACLQGSPVVSITSAAPGGMSPALIELFSLTPGVSVSPSGAQAMSSPFVATLQGAQPGQTVTLMANAIAPGGGSIEGTDQCCAAQLEVTIPDGCEPSDTGGGGGGSPGDNDGPGDDFTDVAVTKKVTHGPDIVDYRGRPAIRFEWEIGVSNTGTTTVPLGGSLVVRDQIQAGTTVIGTAGTDPGFQCGSGPFAGPGIFSCVWQGGPVAPGASVGTIRLQTVTVSGPVVNDVERNCVSVALRGPDDRSLDDEPSNDTACAQSKVKPDQRSGSLSIDKRGPSLCTAGRACNYEVALQAKAGVQGVVVVEDRVEPGNVGRLVGPAKGWRCERAGRGQLVCARVLEAKAGDRIPLPVTLRPDRGLTRGVRIRQCAAIAGYEKLPRRLAVRLLQERLGAAGFYPGAIDGLMGPRTRHALKAYLSSMGKADGEARAEKIAPALLEAVLGPALPAPPDRACVATTIRPAPLARPKKTPANPSDGGASPGSGPHKPGPVTCPPLMVPREDGKGCRQKVQLELKLPFGGKKTEY